LVRLCLDHLSRPERDALERDLELAARVQRGLLPRQNLDRDGWEICYYYEPAGMVSGDYCDVIDAGEAGLYFMVGDVSGKGVAASIGSSRKARCRTSTRLWCADGRCRMEESRSATPPILFRFW
jgi:serine phosphatase RsbU (regulator of sigma subunit)